jgi:DNA-binding MarR family transcriptional regulator
MATYAGAMEPLSSDDTEVWHAFKALGDTVMRRVGAELTAATGLSSTDWGVVSRLEDLGGGRMGQTVLAESMGLTKGGMSNQLTRMTHRGLVQRERSADGVTVVLTDHGRELLHRARPVHAAAIRTHLLDRLSADQRAAVLQIAARVAE